METGAEFEQGGDAAVHRDAAAVGAAQPGGQVQQRAFSGAVMADDGEAFPVLERKGNLAQGVEPLLPPGLKDLSEAVAEQNLVGVADEGLPHVLEHDRGLAVRYAHRTWA